MFYHIMMKKRLSISSLVILGLSLIPTLALANSTTSRCVVTGEQPNEFELDFEVRAKDFDDEDASCTIVSYELNNEVGSATVTEATSTTIQIKASAGDQFEFSMEYKESTETTVQSFSYDYPVTVEVEDEDDGDDEDDEDEDSSSCMSSVVDQDGRYSIKLVGLNGARSANCRFTEYSYEVESGEAEMIGMNEYVLFFDGTLVGTVKVTVTEPTDYWAEFKIGQNYSGTEVPPAGYEEEVITTYNQNPFPDTDLSGLEGVAAAELYRRAVIGGYPDGEFKGSKEVNRAEAAKFLLYARYGTIEDLSNNGRFPDVLDGQWYVKFVVKAADLGIISGYPDKTFGPADTVNTAEFLKMLTLTFGLEENQPYSYSDVLSTDWYARYAGTAEAYDLFPERTTQLYPSQDLTRGEVAVAIYQYLLNR